jgi:deoxyribodipyrimidine photolyase-related protein
LDFVDKHKEEFEKNHRMSQQANSLNQLSDLPVLRDRAKQVLEELSEGTV